MTSIIMPAYNAESTIYDSIESVIKQSYEKWELIIINDGSTDDTIKVVSQFKDSRIKLISQENKGVAEARNTGIRFSNGDFIAFLDSDDIWDEKKLEIQINYLTVNDIDLLHTDFFYFSTNITDRKYKKYIEPYNFDLSDHEKLLINDVIVASSVIIRKNTINSVGYFDSSFYGVEDWDYWIRLSKDHKIGKIDNPLTYYRENMKGISKNLERQLNQELLIRKKHLTILVSNKVRKLSKWQYLKKNLYYHYVNNNYIDIIKYYFNMSILFPFKLEKTILLRKVFE
jgi:glycosyltransferase involved in cell wall biosynthesis